MSRIARYLVFSLVLSLQCREVSAHFLFIRIGTHAEAGRAVDVFFSERAEAGDPQFIGKIAHAQLWMQSDPGKFSPLQVRTGTDRLRAFLSAEGAVSVSGMCEYGVLTRKVPFLLRYYPKAISGKPELVNKLKPHQRLPFEIVATVGRDAITVSALRDGKPVPGAKFTTVDDDLVNQELTADESGRVTWKPDGPGHYCLYAKLVEKKPGERNGEKYAEIRSFATLAFRWPLQQSAADPAAVKMFQRAIAARAVWKNFPGFTARVAGMVDDREFFGKAQVDTEGTLQLDLDEQAAAEWVDDQLSSVIIHRLPSSGRGTPVLNFADNNETHPLGRLLTFTGGHFASSYRVRDGRLSVVNRNLGRQNMTILVLDDQRNAEGKFLPRSYLVHYWDAKTGRLDRTETIRSRWQRVGAWDLPVEHSVSTASSAGLSVRTLRLSDHKILKPSGQ